MGYTNKEYHQLIFNLSIMATLTRASTISDELLCVSTQLSFNAPFVSPEEVADFVFAHRAKHDDDIFSEHYENSVIPANRVIIQCVDRVYPSYAEHCQNNLHLTSSPC